MECDETKGSCRKPRVVIVGAGLAGLSAACRLVSVKNDEFEVSVVEGSQRIGGRICSSEFGGERVELGATWIHGIEGSPIYDIAVESGAFEGDLAWECMDGFPPRPIVKAEGGFTIDTAIVDPIVKFYKNVMYEAQSQQQMILTKGYEAAEVRTLGGFLKERLNDFLDDQSEKASASNRFLSSPALNGASFKTTNGATYDLQFPIPEPSKWTARSLSEGVFAIQENSERSETAADSLYDLDLASFGEYWELPGKQITIPKGFSSVIHSLSKLLPPDSIQLGKTVEVIRWNDSTYSRNRHPVELHCQDGSTIEADHVIITVSLGVLKAGVKASKEELTASQVNNVSNNIQNLDAEIWKDPMQCKKTHEGLFQPPLPTWKVEAIDRLGFGVVDKVFTLLKPSHGDCYSHMQFIYRNIYDKKKTAIPSWMRKTCSMYPIHSKSHILSAWFVGKEALQMEAMPNDQIMKAIMSTLSEFGFRHKVSDNFNNESQSEECKPLAKTKAECKFDCINGIHTNEAINISGLCNHCNIKHSKWGRDPLYLGSYSYIAAGSSGVDMDILAEPLPARDFEHKNLQPTSLQNLQQTSPALQLLFAGEATHRYHYSTTHGAYFSGVREADRLLRHYGWLK